jgi:hypothetical protein
MAEMTGLGIATLLKDDADIDCGRTRCRQPVHMFVTEQKRTEVLFKDGREKRAADTQAGARALGIRRRIYLNVRRDLATRP